MDLFAVPTASLRLLYGFFVIEHGRRHILHFNATYNPTSAWVIQQLREAFPYDTAPRYLVFDRDAIFSPAVVEFIRAMGTKPVRISYRSPWQNGTAERWIGNFLGKGSQGRFRNIAAFAAHIREFFEFRDAFLRALGFQPWYQCRSVLFFYSDLTAAVTCWSPHASSTGGRSSRNFELGFNRLLSMATSTSWMPERPPCRKLSGGGSPTVTHCRERSYASLADVS